MNSRNVILSLRKKGNRFLKASSKDYFFLRLTANILFPVLVPFLIPSKKFYLFSYMLSYLQALIVEKKEGVKLYCTTVIAGLKAINLARGSKCN